MFALKTHGWKHKPPKALLSEQKCDVMVGMALCSLIDGKDEKQCFSSNSQMEKAEHLSLPYSEKQRD